MKILFYGRLVDAIGPELEIDAPHGCSVADLRQRLISGHPDAEDIFRNSRARACVGDVLVHDGYVLRSSDKVEFLPPVSGG
jgi:sulfur-carrier protein